MRPVLVVVLAILMHASSAAAQSKFVECPAPRPPADGIEAVIGGAEIAALGLQGLIGFEGDRDDARPLPKASLYDLAGDLGSAVRRAQRAGQPVPEEAIYFTFHSDTSPSRNREVISAPRAVLWCLVRRGDTVLLSDGATPHITSVYGINRSTDSIFILDPWPDRFFMLRENNVRGYTAELADVPDLVPGTAGKKKLVRIPRAQFLRVLVGYITLDTPDLIDHYFSVHPPAQRIAETHLSFANTLLGWPDDRFVERALVPLRKANELLQSAKNTKEALYAANRLNLALLIHYYRRFMARDPAGAEASLVELETIWRRHGKEQTIAQNRPIDYFRLGLSAGRALDLDSAISFFTRAIERNPSYEEAYLYRAVAHSQQLNPQGVIADATEALRLNAGVRVSLAKQKASRHKRDAIGQARDAGTEFFLDERRSTALHARGTSYRALKEFARALADGQALVTLSPTSPNGHALVGFVQVDLGNTAEGRQHLERAMALETNPAQSQHIKDALAKIPPL